MLYKLILRKSYQIFLTVDVNDPYTGRYHSHLLIFSLFTIRFETPTYFFCASYLKPKMNGGECRTSVDES